MVFVFGFAEAIRGSKRWIDIGPFQFQPSEFGKVLFVLAIAGFLVERQRELGRFRTVAHRARARCAADAPRVPPARPRHRARLRRGALGRAASSPASAGSTSRCSRTLAATLVLGVLWFLPSAGVEVLKPYQTARLTGFANPDADPSGLDVQRHAVDHRGRRRRDRRPRRRRGEPDAASTTSPSTRPTSCSPRSPSSEASSAPRSCCCSTSSSSGGVCAWSPSPATCTAPSSPAGSSSPSSSRSSSTSA